jgi:asparagine synthase (glutamine-hydrolysing)
MDVSGAVEVYVNQRAKSIAPIRLTGNYGSEVLRSNVAFRPRSLDTSQFTPRFKQFLELAEDTYRHEATGNRLSFIAFKQMPWHHYGRFSIEKSQLTPRSPYLDNELVCLAYRCPQELQFSAVPVLHSVVEGNSALERVETDRALRRHTVPVFGRVSTFWQEFTAKAEYAYDYGMPRWLARTDRRLKLLHLERVFLGRHKFYHFRVWYRDRLAQHFRDHFAFNDQPSCYIQGIAKKLVEEHTSGHINRTLELHQLFTVQLINRLLITP